MKQLFNVIIPDTVYSSTMSDPTLKIWAKADVDGVELIMHGVVGDPWMGLDSGTVGAFLSQHKDKPVTLRVNSPGGFAFDGIAIANALSQHPKQTTAVVEGIAASAAAIAIQGADHRIVYDNAQVMVHNTWTVAAGNASYLRDVAGQLEKLDAQLVQQLARRSGQSVDKIRELFDGNIDGTYLSAQEAVDWNLADGIKETRGTGTKNTSSAVRREQMAARIAIANRLLDLDK